MKYNIFLDYALIFGALIITLGAQIYVSSVYNRYKKIKNKKVMTGYDAARKILDSHNLTNIHIIETKGNLNDHYDPTRKVIRLSTDIYQGDTIAAVSVAAHECGHAIQDKDGYTFLKIRNKLVPFVNLCSKLGYFAILIGIIFQLMDLAVIGIVLLVAMLVFQLITLPVEFNASTRAKQELNKLTILDDNELKGSNNMLQAAAFTYVASLVATLLQVLRYIVIFRNND